MFLKRCSRCKKFLLFNKKKFLGGDPFCEECHNILLDEKKKSEEIRRIQESSEKNKIQERSRLRAENAKRLLMGELEQKKINEKRKFEKSLLKRKEDTLKSESGIKSFKGSGNEAIVREINTEHFSEEDIQKNKKLLYVEADVKRIKVIEWLDGKKRVVLNKSREVRRTHAGGYSQEKFQKYVKHKKEKTFEWISNLLERPGVLRLPYDKMKVISKDSDLRDKIYNHLQKINTP